ncbi:ATP-binding protein [Lentzea sp. NPDC042327]|uniref:sensor histidine kinase n=1 Tax=Lentzea sp. NPDC042327 TaxID=3154801 RepID=UPI0033C00083
MPGVLLEARLLATVSRLAGPVRGAGVVLISLFGALSAGSAAGWTLFAFVVLTSAADFRLPGVALPVAFARVVVLFVVLGGTAEQWTLTVLTTTLITWQWQHPPRVTVPATALLLVVAVTAAGPDVLVRAVLESVLARLAYELLRRSSRRVDVLRERAASQNRAAAVALDRSRREREYLALLHDTAAATFLMAAHGGEPSAVAAQARRDLVVLAERDNAQGTVDLGAALVAVGRDRAGVRVAAGSAVAGGQVDARVAVAPVEAVPVPAVVALAFVRSVRELLTNVARHAPGATADVVVSRVDGGATVVVRDDGPGFVPADVAPHRRGVRESVVERVRAVGGSVEIDSVPGAGTTVRLAWTAGKSPADHAAALDRPATLDPPGTPDHSAAPDRAGGR